MPFQNDNYINHLVCFHDHNMLNAWAPFAGALESRIGEIEVLHQHVRSAVFCAEMVA